MTADLRVMGRAAYMSLYDYFGLYNPKAYVLTWIPRVVLEALFYALLSSFIGGQSYLAFMLVGLAGYRTLHSTVTFTSGSVTGELFNGTVPLLVGAPTDPIIVLTGRNLAWMFHGLSTGVITMAVAVALGVQLTVTSALGVLFVLVVIELSAFGLGLFVGSVVLRFPGFGNLVGNIVGFTLFAIAGVTTPLAVLPSAVQTVALALPLSHGLLALRAIVAQADAEITVPLVTQEILIGALYLLLATFSYRLFLDRARRRGTLDYQ